MPKLSEILAGKSPAIKSLQEFTQALPSSEDVKSFVQEVKPSELVSAGWQALADVGWKVGKAIGETIGYIPDKLTDLSTNVIPEYLYKAATGKDSWIVTQQPEIGKMVFGTIWENIGKIPWNIGKSVWDISTNLSWIQSSTNEFISGNKPTWEYISSVFSNLAKSGESGAWSAFSAVAPVFSSLIQTGFKVSWADEKLASAKESMADEIANAFWVTGSNRDAFKEWVISSIGIASMIAWVKGAKTAAKWWLSNVAAGTLQATLPDITTIVAEEFTKSWKDKRAFDTWRISVPLAASIIAGSPITGWLGKKQKDEVSRVAKDMLDSEIAIASQTSMNVDSTAPVEKAPNTPKTSKLKEAIATWKVVQPKVEPISVPAVQPVVKPIVKDVALAATQEIPKAFTVPPEQQGWKVTTKAPADSELYTELKWISARNEIPSNAKIETGNIIETKVPSLTTGWVLDAIKINGNSLWSIMRGIRWSAVSIQDAIINNFKSKTGAQEFVEPVIKPRAEDWIGWEIKNDESWTVTPITQENLPIIQQKLEESLSRIRGNLTDAEFKALNDQALNGEFYAINRNRPEVLKKYFTPEQIAKYESQYTVERDTNATLGKLLNEIGLLTKEQANNENYVRYMTSKLVTSKISGKDLVVDIPWFGERKFDDPVQALIAINAARKLPMNRGNKQIDEAAAKIYSIFKEKGGDIDIYRFQSPLIRTLSYAENVGKAIRDYDTIRAFEMLANSKDKNVRKQVESMYGNRLEKNTVAEILWLGRSTNAVEKVANFTSKAILFGRIKPLIQAFTSTLPRGIALLTGKSLAWDGSINIAKAARVAFGKDAASKEIQRQLESDWLTGSFDIIGDSKVESFFDKWVAISSGAPVENATKTVAGLSMMKDALVKNWVDIKKLTWLSESDPLAISRAWKKWSTDPANKEAYLDARDSMEGNLRFLGDVWFMSKTPQKVLSYMGAQSLKPYLFGQVNSFTSDANRIINAVTKWTPKDAVWPASRQLYNVGMYMIAWQILSNLLQDEEGYSEELANKVATSTVSDMFGGNPLTNIKQVVEWAISNPAAWTLATAIRWLVALGYGLSPGNENEKKDAGMQFAKSLLGQLGISQPLDLISLYTTDKSFLDNLANVTNSVSPEWQSAFGYATGNKLNTFGEMSKRLIGYNTDRATQDLLYEKLWQLDYQNKLWPSLWPVAYGVSTLLGNIYRPITTLQSNIAWVLPTWEAQQNRLDQYAAKSIIDAMDKWPANLPTFLKRLWLDEDSASVISTEIPKMLNTEAAANKQFGDFFRINWATQWLTPGSDIVQIMSNLEKQNPALFNSVVEGFAKMKQKYDMKDVYGENAYKQVGQMFNFNTPNPSVAAAISALRWTNPNVTSLSNSVSNAISDNFDMSKLVNKEDREKAKENLKQLDDMFAVVYQNYPLTEALERSIALASIRNKDYYSELFKDGTGAKYMEVMPNILSAIKNGLEYRWYVPSWTSTWLANQLSQQKQEAADTSNWTWTSQVITESKPWTTLSQILQAYKPMKVDQTKQQQSKPLFDISKSPTLASLLSSKK